MTVLYPADSAAYWLGAPTPWRCVECGEPVAPPCVHWQGVRTLLLHAECAASLGPHLIADARECELAGDPGPHWRRRAVATVRHRLQAAEVSAA